MKQSFSEVMILTSVISMDLFAGMEFDLFVKKEIFKRFSRVRSVFLKIFLC